MKSRIIPVKPEEQFFLDEKKDLAIPLVARNKKTGWPLLDLGIFQARTEDTFVPIIGGGKCRFLPYGLYSFAKLLLQNKKFKFKEPIEVAKGIEHIRHLLTHKNSLCIYGRVDLNLN